MKITILHQHVPEDAAPDERDVLIETEAVRAALVRLGHETDVISCDVDLGSLDRRLAALRPDLAFNLVETFGGTGRLHHVIPSFLETRGIAYTGCSGEALLLSTDKVLTKRWLARFGVPVPPSHRETDGPCILKPLAEDASLGIDASSVIPSGRATEEALATRGPGWFAEAYIPGREINVALLDGEVLPLAEIRFEGDWSDRPRIVGYQAKWTPGSFEYERTVRTFAVELETRVALEIPPDRPDLLGSARAHRVRARRPPRDRVRRALRAGGERQPVSLPGRRLRGLARRGRHLLRRGHRSDRPGGVRAVPMRADLRAGDGGAVEALVRATGFFNPEEIAIAVELVTTPGYRFLFAEDEDGLLGYTCYGAVPATTGSFDLYWIAVHPRAQNAGVGRALLAATERAIALLGGARIWVETSGRAQYAPTRTFYERCGYRIAAVLDDYYAPGDAKVIFFRRT